MICVHLLARIFIKFEQCNKKIQRNELVMICARLLGSLIQNEKIRILFSKIKEKKKKKQGTHKKKKKKEREKVGNKRERKKIKKKRKRKIKREKKELFR